jgi:hypothetical protein
MTKPRQVSRTFRGTSKEADAVLASFVAEVINGTAPMAGSTAGLA